MAANVNWNMVYLGNFADMDTNESSSSIESDTPVIGTHGSAGDPLWSHVVDVDTDSTDGDNIIDTDNGATTDRMSYDLGSGLQTASIDSAGTFNALVTFTDGTSATGSVGLIQDDLGNVFLGDLASGIDVTSKATESVEILNEINTNYTGVNQSTFSGGTFVCFATGTMIDTPSGPHARPLLARRTAEALADTGRCLLTRPQTVLAA